jgi:methyl halide transferase
MSEINDITRPEYWQAVYDEGQPRWDKGRPAPPLERAMRQWTATHTGRVLVPGCGPGHEALYAASLGHSVVAVDFAAGAIQGLESRIGTRSVEALERDIFTLSPHYDAQFDWIVEHTCFCAIPLARRDEYAGMMQTLLKPGGAIVALFYDTVRHSGPPFRTTRADIEQHFLPFFSIESLERPDDSFENRQGEEWLALLKRH